MADLVEEILCRARVQMIFDPNTAFIGALGLRLVPQETEWCRSVATDGRNLFYNREFIKGLTESELTFVLGHNIYHCIYDHLGRRGNRDAGYWDMATDFVINATLVHDKVGTMPALALYDPKYTAEHTSEEVYDDLMKNSTAYRDSLDEHLEASGGGDDDGDGDGDGDGQKIDVNVVGKNGRPVMSEEDLAAIRAEIRSDILRVAQQVGAGKVPMGVRRLIADLTAPVMNWREMLAAVIRSCVRGDYTFQRPSRRSYSTGVILPGSEPENKIDIAVTADASGSMTNAMMVEIFSEVAGIMEQFADFTLRLWTFDTEVYGYTEFTLENLQDIYEYQPKGGGGTMFECNWEFMKENDIMPERFIMFTDGYPCGTWGDPDYVDTLFVIHGKDALRIEAPFGITCHYDGPR